MADSLVRETVLKYSDEISLFSIKVLWLDNVIAVNFENNIHYSKNNIITRREQEIPTSISGGMNCDKHGVFLTLVSHNIII